MRRNLLVAHALTTSELSPAILLFSGKTEAGAFSLPARADRVILPALRKTEGGKYEPATLGVRLDDIIGVRSALISAGLSAFDPDLLIVDNVPRGAMGELNAALTALRARGRTRIVLGLRDVLDDPEVVRREWGRARNEDAIDQFYDAVWIYGDPHVVDTSREYGFRRSVAEKIDFTGYFDQRRRLDFVSLDQYRAVDALRWPNGSTVLCMLGGGQDGAPLAEALLRMKLPARWTAIVLTGPYLPTTVSNALRGRAAADERFRVLDFVSEPALLLSRVDRVISMGGYNSVSEILSFDKPALIVPRVKPRLEQWIRADKLESLGLIDVLHPDDLAADELSAWLARDLAHRTAIRSLIDLDGLDNIPSLARDLVSSEAVLHTPALRQVVS